MNIRVISIAAFALLSLGAFAQPSGMPGGQPQGFGGRPEGFQPKERPSAAQMAQEKVDMMNAEVNLTEKQHKKAYKLFKKDFEYREDAMPAGGPGGPMGGPMGGQGGPGMGGPGGGMGPGMGGPGGFGGGMGGPGMGGPGMGGPGMGGPGMGMPGGASGNVVDDAYIEKQDKKLRKILTETQYNQWRSKHPMEAVDLPPVEFL